MPASHVVVLFNAPSLPASHPDYASEAGVLEAVAAVEAALAAAGRRVTRVAVDRACEQLCERLVTLRPDVVFNLFEGFDGGGRGQGQIAGLVELLGFSLTGSPSAALALTQDKARCNWLLQGGGVATPEFCHIPRGATPGREISDLSKPLLSALRRLLAPGPVIVKPAGEDASLGIAAESVVGSPADVLRQVTRVAERYGDVLVERFIAGREFNAAIIGWPTPRMLPLAEIEFDSRLPERERLVTYDAKWAPSSAADLATPVRCPADVDAKLGRRIEQIALAAYRLTGCRDYARIDLRVDARGQVFVLDVNNNCDISPVAGLARAARVGGQSHAEFVAELVANAAARRGRDGLLL